MPASVASPIGHKTGQVLKRGGSAKKTRAERRKYIAVIMDFKPEDYTAFS
jgi:hypothetical protein